MSHRIAKLAEIRRQRALRDSLEVGDSLLPTSGSEAAPRSNSDKLLQPQQQQQSEGQQEELQQQVLEKPKDSKQQDEDLQLNVEQSTIKASTNEKNTKSSSYNEDLKQDIAPYLARAQSATERALQRILQSLERESSSS